MAITHDKRRRGNDYIKSSQIDVSINGGKGNDFISLGGDAKDNVILYTSGDGNDTIYGFNSTSTLSISGDTYSTQVSGYDVIVKVGNGKITLKNAYATADKININNKSTKLKRKAIKLTDKNNNIDIYRDSISVAGSSGDDTINNAGSKVSINAGKGNDYIDNSWNAQNATINTGAGNDYIRNDGSNVVINSGVDDDYINNEVASVTINGGEGNDYIKSSQIDVSINGGSGNDTIDNSDFVDNDNVTISGGTGNDSIYNDSNNILFQYSEGDGNDTITGFNSTSTLSISGDTYSTQVSGYNVIVTVGDEKITLKNVYSTADKININGKKIKLKRKDIKLSKKNKDITIFRDSISLVGSAEDDTIQNYGSKVTINSGAGNDFIENGNGIYKTNGKDSINAGDGDDTIQNNGSNASIELGVGNDYIHNTGSNATISSDSGDNIVDNGWESSLVAIDLGAGNDSIYNGGNNVTISAGKGNDTITISRNYDNEGNNVLVNYSSGDGKDIIEGFKENSTLSISGSSYSKKTSGSDIIVTVGKGKITLVGAASLDKVNIAGKEDAKNAWKLSGTTATYGTTSKTLATVNGVKSKSGLSVSGKTIKLAASTLSKKVSVSGSYAFEFNSDYKSAKITGSSSADTITTAGANMVITAGKGNDSIVSKGKNATITGGAGNDTLTGSSGADVFVYSDGDGNDIITNYAENDKISLKSGAAEISTSGNDVIFNIGSGKITLQKAKGKTITYLEDGNERTYPDKQSDVEYNSDGTSATLNSTYIKNKFEPSNYSTYKDILVTINASAVNRGINIKGNEVANYIIGTDEDDTIYGGAGKDTILGGDSNDELYGEKGNDSLIGGTGDDSLWGGKGTDTLLGGAGNDVFYYDNGDGNDTITDYSPNIDTVVILSSYVAIGNPEADTSGNVTFKIGTGQIVFKNSANKYIQHSTS